MWAAVDEDGEEYLYMEKPYRCAYSWNVMADAYINPPKGTIKRLIGRELTWNDEPVEITGYKD